MRQVFKEIQADGTTADPEKEGATPAPSPAPERQTKPSLLTLAVDQGPQVPSTVKPRERGSLSLRDVDEFIGKSLRVVTRDGSEYAGRLAKAGPVELHFDRHLPGGIFSIIVKRVDIRSLHVSRP